MKEIKPQTVYLPVKLHEETFSVLDEGRIVDKVVEVEKILFTTDQLNEYTANVIKQALKTAAEKAKTIHYTNGKDYSINKQSITNTFEETYRLFSVE